MVYLKRVKKCCNPYIRYGVDSKGNMHATIFGSKVRTHEDLFSVLHEIGHLRANIASDAEEMLMRFHDMITLPILQDEIRAWYIAGQAIKIRYKFEFIATAMRGINSYLMGFLSYSGYEFDSEEYKEAKLTWISGIVDLLVHA